MKRMIVLTVMFAAAAAGAAALEWRAAYDTLVGTPPDVKEGDGVYRVTGYGVAPPNAVSEAHGRLLAMGAAELDGKQRLADLLRGGRVTAEGEAADYVQGRYAVHTRVSGFLKGVRIVERRYYTDGSAEVDLELMLAHAGEEPDYAALGRYEIHPARAVLPARTPVSRAAVPARPGEARGSVVPVVPSSHAAGRDLARVQPQRAPEPEPRRTAPVEVPRAEPAPPVRQHVRDIQTGLPVPEAEAVAPVVRVPAAAGKTPAPPAVEPEPEPVPAPAPPRVAEVEPEPVAPAPASEPDAPKTKPTLLAKAQLPEPPVPQPVKKAPPADVESIRGPYTDLVLDARGLGAVPAFRPKAFSTGGQQVYPFRGGILEKFAPDKDPEVRYVKSLDEAAQRIPGFGGKPLVLDVHSVRGGSKTDLVLDNTALFKLSALRDSRLARGDGYVVIVID
ncbi:MAG: hypothetical protein JXR94_15510 [Candidatus Hydrogenedentes bacterium]|nr:hypothetical protein [Candidatus Hydrogenedentota bacterium]